MARFRRNPKSYIESEVCRMPSKFPWCDLNGFNWCMFDVSCGCFQPASELEEELSPSPRVKLPAREQPEKEFTGKETSKYHQKSKNDWCVVFAWCVTILSICHICINIIFSCIFSKLSCSISSPLFLLGTSSPIPRHLWEPSVIHLNETSQVTRWGEWHHFTITRCISQVL